MLEGWFIDYRCADGRFFFFFLVSPRGMAAANTRYLSSNETRVNAGKRGWKLHLSESNWCQESVGGICFSNKWRAASLQPLIFSNHCWNAVFSNASPSLTVRFLGVEHRGFLREGVKAYRMASMSPLNSPTFFVYTSVVYGLIHSLWVDCCKCDTWPGQLDFTKLALHLCYILPFTCI